MIKLKKINKKGKKNSELTGLICQSRDLDYKIEITS
jgi:hypothetical protein